MTIVLGKIFILHTICRSALNTDQNIQITNFRENGNWDFCPRLSGTDSASGRFCFDSCIDRQTCLGRTPYRSATRANIKITITAHIAEVSESETYHIYQRLTDTDSQCSNDRVKYIYRLPQSSAAKTRHAFLYFHFQTPGGIDSFSFG